MGGLCRLDRRVGEISAAKRYSSALSDTFPLQQCILLPRDSSYPVHGAILPNAGDRSRFPGRVGIFRELRGNETGMDEEIVLSEESAVNTAKAERLWTAPYISLISLYTLVSIGFYMVMPLLAKYAIQHGASVSAAGVIVGMFSITALFARPVAGIISDRFNKKYVFIAATALIGSSLTGYGLSPGIASLVVFRFIHAAAFSVNSTVSLTLAAQIVPRKRTGEGIGYFSLGNIIATAAGPAIGQYIGERCGLSATFLIAGAATLAASAMIFMLPVNGQKAPCTGEKQERGAAVKTDTRIRIADFIAVQVLPLAFFGSVFSMFNGTVGSYLVLLGEERSIANISLYFTINAAALILVRFTAGKVYDRYGLSAVLIPAFILAAAAAAFIGFAQALPIILAAAVIKAFAQGSAQPSIQAESIRKVPEDKSGVATSTYYIGADLGQGLGPMLAGAIATAWGYEVMFASCSVVFLAALLLYCARLFVQNRTSQECIAEQPGTAGETPSD